MADVVMPRLSDSMEEGTILKWLKPAGAEVGSGEELVEIETDKATMTYEADAAGVLEIVAAEGDTLPIGAVIARLGDGSGAGGSNDNGAETATATPAPEAAAESTEVAAEPAAEAVPAAAPPAVADPPATSANGERIKASPLARRLAREQGIDIATLQGTGIGGRIVRADVEAAAGGSAPPAAAPAAAAARPPSPSPSSTPTEGVAGKGTTTTEELSRLQTVVARRMAESKATIPEFALTTEVDMEACVKLRGQIKDAAEGSAPSYNDMVIKAVALALREFPRANGSYVDGRFELYSRVNVGFAVAAQDALLVPTIFDADATSLGTIAETTRTLAARVRSGEITPPELSGGTFTISNLGMFGVTSFAAVINPPQSGILAVAAMTPRAVIRDGEIVIRNIMPITLTADHRILYGADAAEFLARVRALLESPFSLLL